ncbi:MAG: hypothetical protein IT178_15150 [Acidobacteria bacterium]|nr:hypothetical protein [Acidobacteriota bacterium]
MDTSTAREALQQAVDNIEGGYEFLLAYAAQGLATDQGNANSEQLRTYLKRLDDGMAGLEAAVRAVIAGREDEAAFGDFLAVLARDAAAARAALKVVTSRPGISSQLIDNLNASTHVRSLLTDLFLIDEAVKTID